MAAVPRKGFVGMHLLCLFAPYQNYTRLPHFFHPTAVWLSPDCHHRHHPTEKTFPPDRKKHAFRPNKKSLPDRGKNANPPPEKLCPPGLSPFAKGKKKKGRPQPVAPSIVVLMVEGYAIKKTLLLREKN